jgi:Flp pilus assembly protein TadB
VGVIGAFLLGWGILAGLDKARAFVIAATLMVPVPLGCAILAHAWRSRSRPTAKATLFCEAVSGELRSGASLRLALENASVSVEAPGLARLCRGGASFPDLATAVRREFGEIGVEAATVIEHASRLGGPVAPLFDEIAALALARVELTHEVAMATAPARATAYVLLGAPILALGWVLSTGRIGTYLDTSSQRLSVILGLVLAVAGVSVAVVIARRSR